MNVCKLNFINADNCILYNWLSSKIPFWLSLLADLYHSSLFFFSLFQCPLVLPMLNSFKFLSVYLTSYYLLVLLSRPFFTFLLQNQFSFLFFLQNCDLKNFAGNFTFKYFGQNSSPCNRQLRRQLPNRIF